MRSWRVGAPRDEGGLVGAGESDPDRGGGDHHRAVGVLPWRLRAAPRREHQRDDARLQLRDRCLRRHSRLLERGRGAALRPRAARALPPHPCLRSPADDGDRPVARGARRDHRRAAAPRRPSRGRLPPPDHLQELRDDRGTPPQPRRRHHHLRRSVRPVHRHRGRHPCPGQQLASNRRQRHPRTRQDHRRLRERCARQERGPAQRLRRGDRADVRRPRDEGSAENLFIVQARRCSSRRRSPTTSSRASRARG